MKTKRITHIRFLLALILMLLLLVGCVGLDSPANSVSDTDSSTPSAMESSDTTDAETDTETGAEIGVMVNQLVTTNWTLVTIDGAEVADDMTLSFGTDTISGSDGCNTFSGGYTMGNDTLTVADNLASTMMACANVDPEASQQYLTALVGASTFTLDNDTLRIQTGNGELVFMQTINAALDGTSWQLNSLANNNGGITSMSIDGNIFIMFDDGQVSGSGGCNTFNGGVTTSATDMSFGNIASTLMACADEEVGQRETEFFTALGTVATYEIIDQTLTLYDADGATIATFAVDQELSS